MRTWCIAVCVVAGCGDDGGSFADAGAICSPVAPRVISDPGAIAGNPALVATDDGYIVVWSDTRDGEGEIYAARLDAAGQKVGGDVRLTTAAGESAAVSAARSGDEVFVVWHDARDGQTEIYATRVGADGVEIGDDVRVTNDPARSEFPQVATTGTLPAVVWNDLRDGTFQVYGRFLSDIAEPLGVDLRISTGTALSASPSIASSGAGYAVAWHDTRDGGGLRIYLARTDANLVPGEAEVPLATTPGGTADVAWSGDAYGIAWVTAPGQGGEVQVVTAPASGAPAAATTVSDSGSTAVVGSDLVARDGGWAVAWSDARDGDGDVRLVLLGADGTPAGAELPVSDDAAASAAPSLAGAGDAYAVAWRTGDPSGDVSFAIVCP